MIAICVLTRNRPAALQRLIDSLRPALGAGVQLVILQQESMAPPEGYTLLHDDYTVMHAADNLGCAGGRQFLADTLWPRLQADDVLIFLDDDCYATSDGWLDALTGPIRRGTADICGVDGRRIDADGMTWRLGPGEQPDYVSGGRMAVRAAVFERCAFDPRFNPNYYEDVDFCLQARAAGFRVIAVGEVGMAHDDHPGDAAAAAQSRRALVEKWRGRWPWQR